MTEESVWLKATAEKLRDATDTKSMISQLGTFDVENYGDLLYPLVLRRLLRRSDASLSVRHYSPLPCEAPQQAGFETHAARSLFEPEQLDSRRLIIGGGDILRTDWSCVAAHYAATSRIFDGSLRRAIGTDGLPEYLLRKGLPRLHEGDFYARRFRARWMNYKAAGPFIISPEDLSQGSAVCYLSCGVPHDFDPDVKEEVSRAFERARFIYLRDEQSAAKLRRAGVQREFCVAPDLITILSDQFEQAAEAGKGREILSQLGVDTTRTVLCFQSKPYSGFSEAEIVRQLKRYRERTRAEIVLLPVGLCHGDREFLQSLHKQSGGVFKYVPAASVFDIISVIAACDAFVGTSLHGNVTAFSYGIPHLFGPLPVDKAEGFLSVVNLPDALKLRAWDELDDKLDMAAGLGRAFFAERAREAKPKVYAAVDEMLNALLK